MAWAFDTNKPVFSDTPPNKATPPNSFINQAPSIQIYERIGAILIQTPQPPLALSLFFFSFNLVARQQENLTGHFSAGLLNLYIF